MIALLLGLAVLAAVLAVGVRRWERTRAARRRPGATIHCPVLVSRFDEIDAALYARTCACGGGLVLAGETSRVLGDRRFRVVRLVCGACDRDELMYFDVTPAFQ